MTPTQYKTAIASLGISQVGAARFLGVDDRTSRRWISGERDVPEPVSRFLRFLIATKTKPEYVEAVLKRK